MANDALIAREPMLLPVPDGADLTDQVRRSVSSICEAVGGVPDGGQRAPWNAFSDDS
jgi:hypothetical protein